MRLYELLLQKLRVERKLSLKRRESTYPAKLFRIHKRSLSGGVNPGRSVAPS